MNLWAFLATQVERTPEKELLRYRDVRQTYGEFGRDALRAASALRDLGVQPGENVCLMLGNNPDHLQAVQPPRMARQVDGKGR